MELLDKSPGQEHDIFSEITPEWAWKGSTGKGVKVAVIDSGVDHTHPELKDCVKGGVEVSLNDSEVIEYKDGLHSDAYGHATACAGIIRGIAPEVNIYSVKVLGANLTGTGNIMLSGIKWAVDNGMDILNLSLGTTKDAFFATFIKLTEEAYFRKCFLVAALSNTNPISYPAVFSSLVGVKAVSEDNSYNFYLNPEPPVEIFARGIEVRVPWLEHGYFPTSGNSFAAPVITGIATLIKSKHPGLTPVQLKVVLHALAKRWEEYGSIKSPLLSLGVLAEESAIPESSLRHYMELNLIAPVKREGEEVLLFEEKDIIIAHRISILMAQDFTPEEIMEKIST